MTQLLSIFLIILITGVLNAQTINPGFDSALAKSLNADDYGMRNYVFVILKSGSNTTTDEKEIDSVFNGHMQNINRLAEESKLVLAGPFGKNENSFRGLFVLNVESIEEAEELLQTDPAVKANFLKPEFYKWYGTASLQEVLKIHDKIAKYKF